MSEVIAVVFAGGVGSRMGAEMPKQYLQLGDRPVLAHAMGIFQRHPRVDGIYLVVGSEWRQTAMEIVERYGIAKLREVVNGGDSAQESIYNGLVAVAEKEPPDTTVLLHDGARPYLTDEVVTANIDAVERYGNAITYTPCYETIVLSADGSKVDSIPNRSESYTAQAPQSFRLGDILRVHERIRATEGGYAGMVDQATMCFSLGIPVHLVQGCRGNIKVTTPEDMVTLEALLNWRRQNG